MDEIFFDSVTTVAGTCGLGVVFDFSYDKDYAESSLKHLCDNDHGGTGFVILGFINDRVCYDTYTQMRENYQLCYQSPVRFNVNSGNRFFFCIFDLRTKP